MPKKPNHFSVKVGATSLFMMGIANNAIYNDSYLAPTGYETACALPSYPVFDVQDYGAKGNGIADDTVAIRSAISAATTRGSGIIFFPAGNYAVQMQPGDTGTYGSSTTFPCIFVIASGQNNLVFLGDGPIDKSYLIGYTSGLTNPVNYWVNTGDSYSKISRFGMFRIDSAGSPISGIQWRSLNINGQAGYTGDFSVGGSEKVVSATVASGGIGYISGNILTLNDNPAIVGQNATFRVTGVTGGVVTSVSVLASGQYSFLSVLPISTTGGSGTGCTLNVTKALTGDGWDLSHKGIAMDGPNLIDKILVFNCNIYNWRGEVFYGGGTNPQKVHLINSSIYSSNASAVSLSANLIVTNSIIGSSNSGLAIYNGFECFGLGTNQNLSITNSVIQGAQSNGIAYIGLDFNSGIFNNNQFLNNHNGILFTEAAWNIIVSGNIFMNNIISTIGAILGIYQGPKGFGRWKYLNNSFINNPVYTSQNDTVSGFLINNNSIISGKILQGTFPLPNASWETFVVSGNILGDGAADVGSYSGFKSALWVGTQHPSGEVNPFRSIGYKYDDFSSATSGIIAPVSDYTWLNVNQAGGNYLVDLDLSAISGYVEGYTTTFRISQSNWVLHKNATWNRFAANTAVTDNLKIQFVSGLFQ